MPPSSLRSFFAQPRTALTVALVFTGLTYLNSLAGQPVFDDEPAVIRNEGIKDALTKGDWGSIFVRDFWGSPGAELRNNKSYRPLVVTTFAINVAMAQDEKGFDLAEPERAALVAPHLRTWNWLLHLGVVALLFGCLRQVLGPASTVPFWAALLFGIHPLHAECVNPAVGRADVMATLFCLAAWYAQLRFRAGQAAFAAQGTRAPVGWRDLLPLWISVGAAALTLVVLAAALRVDEPKAGARTQILFAALMGAGALVGYSLLARRARGAGPGGWIVVFALSYTLALFSKEVSVVWLGVLLLSDILLPQGRLIRQAQPRPAWPLVLARAPLFAGLGLLLAAGFIRVRYEVFIEPEFNVQTLTRAHNSMVNTDPGRPDIAGEEWPEEMQAAWGRETPRERKYRMATAIGMISRYAALHAVPYSLASDYSISSIPLITFGDPEYREAERLKRLVRAFRAGVFDSQSLVEVAANQHLIVDWQFAEAVEVARARPQMADPAATAAIRARDAADLGNDPAINLTFGAGLAIAGGFLVSGVWMWRRRPLWTLGVGLYAFSFALVSNVFMPIGLTFADRTQYMSGTGAMVLLVLLARALARPLGRLIRTDRAWVTIAVVICVAYAARTARRNMDWIDGNALFTSAFNEQPLSVTNTTNYATVLAEAGGDDNYDRALEVLKRTRGLAPFNGAAEHQIAMTLFDRFQDSSTKAWIDSDKGVAGARIPCGKQPTPDQMRRFVDVNADARRRMLDEAIDCTTRALFHLQYAKPDTYLLYANLKLRRGFMARTEGPKEEERNYNAAFQRLREARGQYPNDPALEKWALTQLNTVKAEVGRNNKDRFVWALWYSSALLVGLDHPNVRNFRNIFAPQMAPPGPGGR